MTLANEHTTEAVVAVGATGAADNPSLTHPATPASVAFTIPTPPSVNQIYRNKPGRGRVKSGLYDDFIARAVTAIRLQKVKPLDSGNYIAVFGVERMSMCADIDNRLKAMIDTIVKAGLITDDRFITAIAVSWLPKANGLTHVALHPIQRMSLDFHPSPEGTTGGWFAQVPQPTEGEEHGIGPV